MLINDVLFQAMACKKALYRLNLNSDTWDVNTSLQVRLMYYCESFHSKTNKLFININQNVLITLYKYTTFANKLREGNLGITGWNLFVVDKMTTKMVRQFCNDMMILYYECFQFIIIFLPRSY